MKNLSIGKISKNCHIRLNKEKDSSSEFRRSISANLILPIESECEYRKIGSRRFLKKKIKKNIEWK